MKIWRAADRVSAPWKNGAGTMSVILTSPEGSGWDTLDWRVSTALITRSAAFSHFPGLERVFSPFQGGAVTLRLPGMEQHIGPGDAPFAFSGDADCFCTHDGPKTQVLNLQTRAPYRAVVGYDASILGAAAVARYLFALEPVAEMGLEAGDLAAVTGTEVRAGKALYVAIRKQDLAVSSD
ncbi:HutD/Ves family protein [Puniceibacterium sediminis]|uniref:HutD protein n=1 Tax=Puniceibacterium sediminis TaxID=1608407 RepID=A0A238YWF1_9RHOB|nr:HutD family protein [Puniceibacterium sediminis]SNR75626.1 HutD protein [Puniceibacterium sediminis]